MDNKVLVLMDMDEGLSLAAIGWTDDLDALRREILASHETGMIQRMIGEVMHSDALRRHYSHKEMGQDRNTPYLNSEISKDNFIANLTENGMTKLFDAPVRVLNENDLFSPDYCRNFEALDAVFIVADGQVREVVRNLETKLRAVMVVADYRDGFLDMQPEKLAA